MFICHYFILDGVFYLANTFSSGCNNISIAHLKLLEIMVK